MKWVKRGLIFSNNDGYAQMPTAFVMKDRIRIYFSSRDLANRSRPYFIDVDKDNPKKIIHSSREPILPLGRPGAFDDAGVMPSCAVDKGDGIYLYYVGWSKSVSVPYKTQIGVASSRDGETFEKEGIYLVNEPYLATTPFMSSDFPMIYAAGTGWVRVKDVMEPLYTIKSCGDVCISPKTRYEAICRPSIIKKNGVYRMWFCYRDSFDYRGGKGSYRIGYAESKDSVEWKRDDKKSGISLSKSGFDSKMQCYPNVVKVNERYLMFYCGNNFGKSGIGYAICDL